MIEKEKKKKIYYSSISKDEKNYLVNKYIKKFLDEKESDYYLDNLDDIILMCDDLFKINYPKPNKESKDRYMDLNGSINICSKFFNDLDKELGERFDNIIRMTKTNSNESIVKFKKRKLNTGIVDKDNVIICYTNTVLDMFIITHEMFHKFNQFLYTKSIFNNKIEQSIADNYYSEMPSILSEFVLGKYLIDNKIITENEFLSVVKWRLDGIDLSLKYLLIEYKMINDFKINNKEFDIKDYYNYINDKDGDFYKYNITKEDINDTVKKMIQNKYVGFIRYQKYVVAMNYIVKIINNKEINPRDVLIQINNEISNINLDKDPDTKIHFEELKDDLHRLK